MSNGYYFNEKLQIEIENHFDKEIELKKKLYELENSNLNLNVQINKSNTDQTKLFDDKTFKNQISQLRENQKSNIQIIESIQQEYNLLLTKRVLISSVIDYSYFNHTSIVVN